MKGFLKIPNDVRYSRELTPTEKMLVAEVISYAGKDGWSNISSRHIAQALNISVRHAKGIVSDLVVRGWLKVERSGNRRRISATVKPLPKGEPQFTVKQSSPCNVVHPQGEAEFTPKGEMQFTPYNKNIINKNINKSVTRTREDVVGDVLANEGWCESLMMHNHIDAATLARVIREIADWLYLRDQREPSAQDIMVAASSNTIIKQSLNNINNNGNQRTKANPNDPGESARRRAEFANFFAAIESQRRTSKSTGDVR